MRRTEKIEIRVTLAEKRAIKKRMRAAKGKVLSSWLRDVALGLS